MYWDVFSDVLCVSDCVVSHYTFMVCSLESRGGGLGFGNGTGGSVGSRGSVGNGTGELVGSNGT